VKREITTGQLHGQLGGKVNPTWKQGFVLRMALIGTTRNGRGARLGVEFCQFGERIPQFN